MKKKNIVKLSSIVSALLLSVMSASVAATADTAAVQTETIAKSDMAQIKAIRIEDKDKFSGSKTEDIGRSLNASALTDSAFLNSCCKSRYGYTKLASTSNGTKRQSFYNELMDACIKYWHSNEDVKLQEIGDENEYIIMTLDFSDNGINEDEAIETLATFKNDNPVFYFISNTVLYSTRTMYLETDTDYIKGSVRTKHNTNIKNYLNKSASVVSSETRLCRKAKKLYDKLINDVEYAYINKSQGIADESVTSYNVIGAIENGRSVCEGYAKTFQLLASFNGLDTVYVSGVATNSSNKTGRHAWNMIKLDDGNYYNFDITWDDSKSKYKYFAVGSNTFSNHKIDSYRPNTLNYMYPIPAAPAADFDESKVHFHSYGAWTVTSKAACTSDGTETRVCTTCKNKETRTIKAAGHKFKNTVKAATCTEQGYTEHTCTVCNYSYKDTYTAATGHTFGSRTTTKSPTCTQTGTQVRSCTKCRYSETNSIPAKGHSYNTEVVLPTCIATGYTKHTCTVCGNTYNDSYVSTTSHNYNNWIITKQPTCTNSGLKTHTCKTCGHQETVQVNANGHTYTTSVVKPTCTEMGYTLHTCTVCGNSFKDCYIGANGHRFGDWQTMNASSCTAEGSEYRECRLCGEREVRNSGAKGHNYAVKVVEPTCTTKGYTVHTCKNCGSSYTDNEKAPTHHKYNERVKAATCTEKGLITRTCVYCGNTKTEEIAPTGHNYNSVTAAPTCTAAGYTKMTCTGCGKVIKTNIIAAKGHSFGSWTTTVEPTADRNGEKVCVCNTCGERKTAEICASGHSFTQKVIAPTCTGEGYTEYTCNETGETYKDNFTAPKGHSFGEWHTTVEATNIDCGEEEHICSVCGERETRTIDKLEYNFIIVAKRDYKIFMKCTVSGEELTKSFETEKKGDVDGDDTVDLNDLALFQQYLAGWNVGFGKEFGDINCDGKVDLDDIALVQQYLAGWNVNLEAYS